MFTHFLSRAAQSGHVERSEMAEVHGGILELVVWPKPGHVVVEFPSLIQLR